MPLGPTGVLYDVNGNPVGTATNPLQTSVSGTVTVSGSISATNPSVSGTGTSVPSSATFVGGTDGTLLRAIKTDVSGNLITVGSGTAGSPLGGVLTIQGILGGQPIPITGSISSVSTNPSVGLPGATAPSSASYIAGTDGTFMRGLRTDVSGNISITTQVVSGSWPEVKLNDSNSNVIRATVSEELKVAQLYTLADLTNKYELDTRLWDYQTSSGGAVAHVPLESAVRLSANTTAASSASLRTNTYYK